MTTRSIAVLIGVTVVIAVGTLVQDFRFDSLIARNRATALAVDREVGALASSLADLRAAQAGYVATGQAPATWMARADAAFAQLDAGIRARMDQAPDGDLQARYGAARRALDALGAVDRRARRAIEQDDRLHAADLVFMDASEPAEALAAAIAGARDLESGAWTARIGRWNALRLALNGLGIVLIAVIAVYFGRAIAILGRKASPTTAQMLKDLPPPVKDATALNPSPATPAAGNGASAAQRHPAPALAGAAALCADLARVLDGRELPALVARAAELVGARGLVLWAVDAAGARLIPSICHGYPEKVVTRLRPLQVDGDNVTAMAFRTLQTQTLPGSTDSPSAAIAVPLVTASGCVGVLAVEIPRARPEPDTVHLAAIVAAQLATVVTPIEEPALRGMSSR